MNKTTLEYNSALRIEEEKEYTDKGILKERKVRNYDAHGNCIETTIFNPDGKPESKYYSIYDILVVLPHLLGVTRLLGSGCPRSCAPICWRPSMG